VWGGEGVEVKGTTAKKIIKSTVHQVKIFKSKSGKSERESELTTPGFKLSSMKELLMSN
jgi:hypothetical protein